MTCNDVDYSTWASYVQELIGPHGYELDQAELTLPYYDAGESAESVAQAIISNQLYL